MTFRFQQTALIVGCSCLLACVGGWWFDTEQFFPSWLFAVLFWLGLSLGCLPLLMLHHLAGGRWGFLIRRFLEAAAMLVPLMAVCFVPIFFGLGHLYRWAHPEIVAADKVLQYQQGYLNPGAFIARSVTAFGIWTTFAILLNRYSVQQDETSNPEPTRRLRTLSGPGLLLHTLVGTFAYVDWIMTLERDWYSSIFLVLLLVGQMLLCIAFAILLLTVCQHAPPLAGRVGITQFHQLGNLLLAFVLVWTYLQFSQFLIQWAGNLPREISWYLHRSKGGWGLLIVLLAVFHFFVPFAVLLFRETKRRPVALAIVAATVFAANAAAVFWMIAPSFHPEGFRVHWLDFAAFAGVGGLWLAAFATRLRTRPLLPLHDPRFTHEV
jgi:hypothetical protein